MDSNGIIRCLSCGAIFEDYDELAKHILLNKKGHSKGRRWAAKYSLRHTLNKRVHKKYERVPLTAEEKAKREDTRRVLSGGQRVAETICPKCKRVSRIVLEDEYVSSPQAWMIQGKLAKICTGCG